MILMKFVSKVVIFNKIKNPSGPLKELHGPPVEKHCYTPTQKKTSGMGCLLYLFLLNFKILSTK